MRSWGDATMNAYWRPQRRSAAMARGMSWLAALGAPLVGILYLLGWALDMEMLRPGVAGIPMTPVTGIAMVFGGTALGLRLVARPFRHREPLAIACALVAMVIGALNLLREVTGWDAGLERLVIHLLGEHTSSLPRPSPLTATCTMLLGLALLLLNNLRLVRLRDTLVVLSLVSSTLGLNGLLMGPLLIVGTLPFLAERSMGLPTALTMTLLGVGTLCARPEQGLVSRITRDSLGGFVARRLVPMALLGPSLLGMVLMVLRDTEAINMEAKLPIFATLVSVGGAALVLLSARALDAIEARRLQASLELEASEARYRGLLNHTPVGILFAEPGKDTLVANPVAEAMLGSTPHGTEQTGYHPPLLTAEGHLVRTEDRPIVRAMTTGRLVGPEEYLIEQPHGRRLPVLVTAAPVHGFNGSVRGVVCTLQDVTTRHELDQLREEYVSLISHDLRNPLHTIGLRVGLLRRALRERKLEQEETMTESIQRSVTWMSAMIEELLEGSRLESQRETLRREPRDLVRFLDDVMERDVPPDARERFHLEVQGALPPVWVDAARLERVVANLLSNAAKYSPDGGPITVRAQLQKGQVVVSVKDQGPGLTEEDAAHVFDKYYRTRKGGTVDVKGLGLGLYICRLIIEAHGGRIWVESAPGQGSTFSFSLPVEPPGEPPPPPRAPDDRDPAAGDGSALSASPSRAGASPLPSRS
ncbi:Sensory box histidine kinase [Myxococcus hansupus]|uniref:histidine kinase n=1 Tax=Pseudomyxococcus hansupus TaxID=1297742 RepID=A0A0H4X717_9BACT|nr:ATP-binding protein [Myxococcus hansupus]AKQ69743.1 Sensory box histidine kinase [Myxococcus hansupus]